MPLARGGFNFSIEFTRRIAVPDRRRRERHDQSRAIDAVALRRRPTPIAQRRDRRRRRRPRADRPARPGRVAAGRAARSPRPTTSRVARSRPPSSAPSWGADVTRQALRGLVVFLLLAGIDHGALLPHLEDVARGDPRPARTTSSITAGIYALSASRSSPAAVIGFLTILGYSLYDTVVVFDKIRENTDGGRRGVDAAPSRESVNLAVNQTLVRSINTSVVAALPVAAILFIGAVRARRRTRCATSRSRCSSASSSAPTRRSSSPRRSTRSCARASRRSQARPEGREGARARGDPVVR